jgi:hypothetical protein
MNGRQQSMSARRRKRSQDQLTSAAMPLLGNPEPGDGSDGFPPDVLAREEPRMPIGKLGFTEGKALLNVGENVQKGISVHAAQNTTTPISWALTTPARPRGVGDLIGEAKLAPQLAPNA